jgi:hypothetical protein
VVIAISVLRYPGTYYTFIHSAFLVARAFLPRRSLFVISSAFVEIMNPHRDFNIFKFLLINVITQT